MARYRATSSRRRATRSSRSSYRAAPARRSYRSRGASRIRRSSGGRSRQQVVRLEIVQAAPNPVARPDLIGQKPASAPRKAMF